MIRSVYRVAASPSPDLETNRRDILLYLWLETITEWWCPRWVNAHFQEMRYYSKLSAKERRVVRLVVRVVWWRHRVRAWWRR